MRVAVIIAFYILCCICFIVLGYLKLNGYYADKINPLDYIVNVTAI